MALICDTSGIYALYDADDGWHDAVRDLVEREHGPLIVSDGILAEIDYLLTARLGSDAVLDFISAVRAGDFQLETCRIEDLARARIRCWRITGILLSDWRMPSSWRPPNG